MSGPASGPVLVCFAVPEEAVPLRKALPPGVEVVVSGMGAAAAERAVKSKLAERNWRLVLTCGFAGGLSPDLPAEKVVFDADENFPLRLALTSAGAVPARFHCAERVAVTAREKAALRERTGAEVVEMESGVIRRLCRERGIPSATVRVISDAAHEDLPLDFNALMQADGRLNVARLALAVLSRPQKIPALMALGRRSKAAAARLASVLETVLRG